MMEPSLSRRATSWSSLALLLFVSLLMMAVRIVEAEVEVGAKRETVVSVARQAKIDADFRGIDCEPWRFLISQPFDTKMK